MEDRISKMEKATINSTKVIPLCVCRRLEME
jgi:hypothetical protein